MVKAPKIAFRTARGFFAGVGFVLLVTWFVNWEVTPIHAMHPLMRLLLLIFGTGGAGLSFLLSRLEDIDNG